MNRIKSRSGIELNPNQTRTLVGSFREENISDWSNSIISEKKL